MEPQEIKFLTAIVDDSLLARFGKDGLRVLDASIRRQLWLAEASLLLISQVDPAFAPAQRFLRDLVQDHE